MPYNPDEGNTERWRFRCSCAFGKWVDPASTPSLWGGRDMCTTRNYMGWLQDALYVVNAVSAVCLFVFTCNTWMRLRRESSKGCCKMKLGFELVMLMVQFALLAVCFILAGPCSSELQAAGVNHKPLEFFAQLLFQPIPTLWMFNVLIVAVTWTHVATNARAFRKVTPGTAKKRARIFVGCLVTFSCLGLLVQWVVDTASGSMVFLLCAIVVVVVYLVGSCKLQAVIEVQMVSGSTPTGDRSTSTVASTRSRAAVGSVLAWATQKSGGAKRRHQHLQTILEAARGIVAVCCIFITLSAVYVFQRQGVVRETVVFLIWHLLYWGGYVLVRYYRKAIFAGAMRKRKDDLRKGDTGLGGETGETKTGGGTISNASVVPVA